MGGTKKLSPVRLPNISTKPKNFQKVVGKTQQPFSDSNLNRRRGRQLSGKKPTCARTPQKARLVSPIAPALTNPDILTSM